MEKQKTEQEALLEKASLRIKNLSRMDLEAEFLKVLKVSLMKTDLIQYLDKGKAYLAQCV